MDQGLKFFKSNTCHECSASIHSGVAACLMNAVGYDNEEMVIPPQKPASPIIHCIACGGQWHSRCLKEFSDLTTCDIVGLYLCDDCDPLKGLNETSASLDDQTATFLSNLTTTLRSYKQTSYRDIMIDVVLERLIAYGVVGAGTKINRSDPRLNEVLDIFLAASGASTSTSASDLLTKFKEEDPPKLSDLETGWLEWGIVYREFLTGLGNSISISDFASKRRPTTGVADLSSVKYKRMDDEDLLLAKRMHLSFTFFTDLADPKDRDVMMDDSPPPCILPGGPMPAPDHQLFTGEPGAVLTKAWLGKYGLNGGYIGPGSKWVKSKIFPISSCIVPDWDTRTCTLCEQRGDQLVMGCLTTQDGTRWVHTECYRWTNSNGVSDDISGWMIDVPVPVAGEPGGLPVSPENAQVLISPLTHETIDFSEKFCAVCDKPGASVYCQQCNTTAYHFPCAVSVNQLANISGVPQLSNRVVMDTRCSLLTCGKCLYRSGTSLDKFFQSEFGKLLSTIRPNNSIFGTLMGMRQPIHHQGLVDREMISGAYRSGSLTILNAGKLPENFKFDGSSNCPILCGFSSIRIFHSPELAVRGDEESTNLGLGKEKDKLKYQKRVAYLNEISAEGKFFSISILGGRTVALGSSLAECFSEFTNVVHVTEGTGEWFFGLTSSFMVDFVNNEIVNCIRREASKKRDKWMYHPQLRQSVVKALKLESDLKPVSSFRHNLKNFAQVNLARTDQLKSLGKEKFLSESALRHEDADHHDLLDPNMVIVEWVRSTALVGQSGESDLISASKPSRLKQASTATLGAVAVGNGTMSMDGPTGNSATKYKTRIAIPDSDLLLVLRSKIHNYGLFSKNGFLKGEYVVEYQGEILRETIADEREKRAERAGNGDGGSCYMFRLDEENVVDATMKGNCARFINHSCNPNCTCKMIEDESKKKHIMIIAKRDISPGEEITYDYQFAVESEKLACLCGAPNCLGRLN